jgi:hypothetical protein
VSRGIAITKGMIGNHGKALLEEALKIWVHGQDF